MLRKLREKKTSKKIFIGLAIVIIPAFAFWGFSSALRKPGESLYVGTIFGKKITALEYKDAREAVKNTAIMLYGDNLSEIQKLFNIETQAWERIILLQEAKKHRINASDQEVVELIRSYPVFQNKDQFDNKRYIQFLQYIFRTQPRIFEEQTRQNLILKKLYNEVTAGVVLNDRDIQNEYRKLNEEISIHYIAGIPSEFTANIVPSEQELKDYFNQNSLEFKQPLSFNAEYVSSESEDKIRAMALSLNKSFSPALKYFNKSADKQPDFGKLARDLGLEVKESGLFSQTDSIPGIGWSPEILNMIIKLEVGQFSPIINMDNRYFILRLKERKEPYIPDFEKIKDKIREAFIKKKGLDIAKEKIEDCLKRMKENPKAIDFIRTAKECGLKSDSTELFKYGGYIPGIGSSDIFWTVAQGLKEDEFSNAIDMGPGGFYIIKNKQKVSLDEKKFESEKKEFSERLLQQKKQEQFSRFSEDLKRKAQLF